MGTRVYVGHIPYEARERDLERFFKGYGRIREILLKRGFAFVELGDPRDADDAVYDLNGRTLLGMRVIVEIAKGRPNRFGGGGDRGYGRRRSRSRSAGRRRSRSRSYGRRKSRTRSRSRSKRSLSDRRSRSPSANGKRSRSPIKDRSVTPDRRSRSPSANGKRSRSPMDDRSRSATPDRRSHSPVKRDNRSPSSSKSP